MMSVGSIERSVRTCVFDHPESERMVERVRVTYPVGESGYGCERDLKGLYGWLQSEAATMTRRAAVRYHMTWHGR